MNKNHWFKENKDTKKELLGQVFTPKHVADFMVNMALEEKPKKVLDPCFGRGIFIDSLIEHKFPDKQITGIELDPYLFEDYCLKKITR
ncbi:N-6 DNA methylase [Sporosarcina sp. P33]|uniref:N-6 DNA methylase n=1 Tax=Sporosarcina sp. P33 TaxID=1930764 RepID=UPI0009C01805|nr:N-6 DNA methylase [Sporosarcina sp. P33]ARD47511.1 hypothetical protein SporoP33_04175 [Sporosarcina sp. P33]